MFCHADVKSYPAELDHLAHQGVRFDDLPKDTRKELRKYLLQKQGNRCAYCVRSIGLQESRRKGYIELLKAAMKKVRVPANRQRKSHDVCVGVPIWGSWYREWSVIVANYEQIIWLRSLFVQYRRYILVTIQHCEWR